MGAATSYRRSGFAQAGPTPGAALIVEAAATNQVRQYNVPGLASATEATLIIVASKPATAEDIYMVAGILSTDGSTKTDLCYAGRNYSVPVGLAVNTYTNGLSSVADTTVLDGGRTRLLGTQLVAANSPYPFTIRVNGQPQEPLVNFDVHQPRTWSSTFFLGGEQSPALTWPGTVYACYLYLRHLRDDEYYRTERYLRQKFPFLS